MGNITKGEAEASTEKHEVVTKKGKLVSEGGHVGEDPLKREIRRSERAPKPIKKWEDFIYEA